jgi:uncharacterized membrane protein (UPF0127 family)
MMTTLASRPLIAALFFLLVGCDPAPTSGLATIEMKLGSKTFTLEVADRDASRAYGLMRRDSMPADHGMIFVFDKSEDRGFWMKDCRIPLDIVFVDDAGRVVSVKQMKPYDRNTTPSDGPAQFAIELNQGAAESAGVKPGMKLPIPPDLKSKD